MKAFYFSRDNKRLRYDDDRVIRTGLTHKVKPPVILCKHGLHGSKRIMDALEYAPGSYLWIVELSGEVIEGHDKVVATERTYLFGFNAEKLLREFARRQALINIEKIKPYCPVEDCELILKWLNTGDEILRSAAESAAWSAVRTAARTAVRTAARSAAESAAESAARSAAESAAWSAAESAAWSAARTAARTAAWSAARSAAEEMLVKMIKNKTGWKF